MLQNRTHYGYSQASCSKQNCTNSVCNQVRNSPKLGSFKNLSKKISFSFQNAKEALQDNTRSTYNALVSYKSANLKEILQSEELSLNCAIAESCFTYIHEKNYLISDSEIFTLAMNLSTCAYNINQINGYNYF